VTCIAAVGNGTEVHIGGDSAGVSNWDLTVRADLKVFRNGPMVFGFTSSFRMGQLLQYALEVPKHDKDVADHRYLATTFIDAVRSCLSINAFTTTKEGQEHGGTFIIGYRGNVYEVHSDFQVSQPTDNVAAVGCGAAYALGAMYATGNLHPTLRIHTALKAAERHSAGVRGPFTMITGAEK
jgi:ATP-dependent protease HslVU (ClpYQ) peptidase subunit